MFLFAPIRWAFKLVYFAVLAAVVYLVVSAFQVVFASHLPTAASAPEKAKAIVVLGASGTDLVARLEQGCALVNASRASTTLVTGTSAQIAMAKSWLSANCAAAAGVQAVVAPDAAAALSQVDAILGPADVIVVTDAIDALWTKGAGSKAGLSVQVSPAQGSEKAVYEELGALWRQATGVAVGRVIGYSHTTWAAH